MTDAAQRPNRDKISWVDIQYYNHKKTTHLVWGVCIFILYLSRRLKPNSFLPLHEISSIYYNDR